MIHSLNTNAWVACALLIVFTGLAVACDGPTPEPTAQNEDGRLIVFTSIYPLEYLAERIGGNAVDVHSLVPPGGVAHAYEPSPADLQRLGKADLLLLNGLGMEPWAQRALDALGDAAPQTSVAQESGTALPTNGDPHVWLDPNLTGGQAVMVTRALIRVDPDRLTEYAERGQEVTADLNAMDAEFAAGLASCAHQTFVTTHAAYGHLAARFGLEHLSVTSLLSEAEPSAQHLASLIDLMEERGIEYLLADPALSDRYAQTIARETGATILDIHPIGSVTPAELADHGDYMGLMRDNLASLQLALECTA
jgi:zinc transport system substrate-binding protein